MTNNPQSPPSFGTDWRKRWVQLSPSSILHRVLKTEKPDEKVMEEAYQELLQMYRDQNLPGTPQRPVDDWEADGLSPVGIRGETVCGKRGRLSMPGLLSRLGAPRCKRCCRKLGIPAGMGAPFNDAPLSEEMREA